jgi:hypothetical protein
MVAIGADEKKKLYILAGLAGVLILVVVFVIKPFGRSGATTDTATTTTTTPVDTAAVQTPPPSPGDDAAPPAAAPAAATMVSTAAFPLSAPLTRARTRSRPKSLRPIDPPPLPPPPPPPVDIPAPDPALVLPARPLASVGGQDINQPLNLPPTRIPQLQLREEPRFLAQANIVGSSTGGATSALDKRLAGVSIGDSARALLEINDGQQTVTRVVQPGDEVEGVRVLRIERVTEGGNTVTRMIVSQNGQEQIVELRPSTNPIPAAGAQAAFRVDRPVRSPAERAGGFRP